MKLELFGSAAKDTFDPKSSDIDLIAEFNNRRQAGFAARFLAFADGAEELLARPVDLLNEAIESFTHGMSFEDYAASEVATAAVER